MASLVGNDDIMSLINKVHYDACIMHLEKRNSKNGMNRSQLGTCNAFLNVFILLAGLVGLTVHL